MAAGLATGARRGLLMKGGAVLEQMGRVTLVAFDKTGTLTASKPVVTDVLAFAAAEPDVVAFAAALEAGSAHPIAQAFTAVQASAAQGSAALMLPQATAMASVPGRGIAADIDGRRWRLGSAAWVAELAGVEGQEVPASDAAGVTEVFLGTDGAWIARFELADAIKPDAQAAIAWFRERGCQTVLLSGDAPVIAGEVARGYSPALYEAKDDGEATRAKMPISWRPSSRLCSIRSAILSCRVVNSPTLIEAPSAPERNSNCSCS